MDNPAVSNTAAYTIDQRYQRSNQPESSQRTKNDNKPKQDEDVKNSKGWRRIVRNFSPSWFSVTMGTGVCAAILISIPWQASWLYYLSIVFFVLNVFLFFAALSISAVRYILWPEIWTVMIQDPNNSLFLGTIPMGFATLIKMWIEVCVPAWGTWAVYFGFGIWVLDSIVAVAVTVSLGILLMSASHQRSLDTITAAQLLPIAATIVAAATGTGVAAVLAEPSPQLALGTIIASYAMWGLATPLAFTVLVVYYHRLALHKLPAREVIVSAFLPLGPLGYGGYTLLYLGKDCMAVFPKTGNLDPMAGKFAYFAGFFVSLIMWGWGLIWFAFALASIYKSRPFPFNMGWWGFTFPLGVYSLSTILIGEELPSLFFRVLGTIFGTAVILLWIMLAFRTAQGAWKGHLFNAPCLANLKKEQNATEEEESGELSSGRSGSGSDEEKGQSSYAEMSGVMKRAPQDTHTNQR